MFDALIAGAAPAAGPLRPIAKAELRRIIGQRLVEARNLNGWNQSTAAEKLGYTNPTQLNLAEQGKRFLPPDMMRLASSIYGVSLDYLNALSDEPERDPKAAERRAVLRQVHLLLERNADAITAAVFDSVADGAPTAQTTRTVLEELRQLAEVVHDFRAANGKKFDASAKLGARLLKRLESARSLIAHVEPLLRRHDNFARRALEAMQQRHQQERKRAADRLKSAIAASGGISTAADQFQLGLDVERQATEWGAH